MQPWDTGATVSAFGNEVHPDLDTQLDGLESAGIDLLDVRSVDGTNVVDLSDDDLDRVAAAVRDRGMAVRGIGSPIGKVDVRGGVPQTATRSSVDGESQGFEDHLEDFRRVLEIADRLGAEHVRVFSYYIPEDDDPADYRGEVIRRMRTKTELAEEAGVTLLHENMPGVYGDTPARVRDLLTAVDSPNFRAIYEAANFYAAGATPFPDALLRIVEYVDSVHVKDARGSGDWATDDDVEIVPVGEGDVPWDEILRALYRRGFDGTFALEPHLSMDDTGEGLSGPEGFARAAEAFERAFRAAEDAERASE